MRVALTLLSGGQNPEFDIVKAVTREDSGERVGRMRAEGRPARQASGTSRADGASGRHRLGVPRLSKGAVLHAERRAAQGARGVAV